MGASPTFGDVVDAHQVEVLRYLRRLTNNGTEADDLFQETFLRALPAFARLRTGSNHRAWLYRIATNVFLNHRRSFRRRKEVPLAPGDDVSSTPPCTENRDHRIFEVYRRAVGALPRRQRAAFVLRRVLGQSYAQIAKTMGGTEGTARANVYQAAHRLRRVLQTTEPPGE